MAPRRRFAATRLMAPRRRFAAALHVRCVAAMLALALAGGCDGEPVATEDGGAAGDAGMEQDSGPSPSFPADFERSYVEMRDCRHSHEHELRYIRVFASPSALAPYAALSADEPYPVGATLVKLEYDDELCAALIEYTSLEKLEPGANPVGGDWLWQRVSPEREVTSSGAPWTCVNCHTYHCAPPYGYDLTCAEEL
jgi:hypothetical protein